MTEKQFIEELKNQLEKNHIEDIDDILDEYRQHFQYKKEEGFTLDTL